MKIHAIKENRNSTQLSTLVSISRLQIFYETNELEDIGTHQIHNFILQTQHLAITFEAKGFFAMDFAPIKDVSLGKCIPDLVP